MVLGEGDDAVTLSMHIESAREVAQTILQVADEVDIGNAAN
jgi:hypothetical protein